MPFLTETVAKMSLLQGIAITCLVMAAISFWYFVRQLRMRKDVEQQIKEMKDSVQYTDDVIGNLAKLIEAFAKLAVSLEKTGPLAMSLFAAMVFVVFALLAAGLGK